MKSEKRVWKIDYNIPEPPGPLLDAGYNPLLACILAIKGVFSPEEARNQFFSDISCLYDPYEMKDMDKAVGRIHQAILNREKIVVYGDYDVDGITSTCLLTDYLRSRGLEVLPYIPDRNDEGYGLNRSALEHFKELKVSLVITVDCGITASDEATYARELGIDMIITDHHECKAGNLPDACAVIDCKQEDDRYPNPNLAGVGVAFKLACACEGSTSAILDRYSDLAAIGTIADVMALTGENRYLVICGLEKLRTEPRPGLAAMMKHSGIDPASVTAASIGFTIAPRLNAAGRLDKAMTACELILKNDPAEVDALAVELCKLNEKRQDIEKTIWAEASKIIEKDPPQFPIVLASPEWNPGVIGIAASRLADQYSLPTIMIKLTDGMGKGSCRSYGGFNLFEALSACAEHLVSFGGHALAAGLNIREEKIDDFRKALAEYYLRNMPEPQPEILCDLLVSDPSLLTEENVRSLDRLEPYGNSNPKPVLCIAGAELLKLQDVGKGRHLKMQIRCGRKKFDCIFFGHTAQEQELSEGDIVDIAFTPQINEFRGKVSVQLQICAVRQHDPEELCRNILEDCCSFRRAAAQYVPERPDFVRVWKTLGSEFTLGSSQEEILIDCPADLSPETYCLCLEVFREAGLLSGKKNVYGARPETVEGKKDLTATPLMRALAEI